MIDSLEGERSLEREGIEKREGILFELVYVA